MSVSSMFELRARVWDRAAPSLAGVEKRTLRGHSKPVTSCSFSPDGGSVVSGSYDKTLKIWDAATGARLRGAFLRRLIY